MKKQNVLVLLSVISFLCIFGCEKNKKTNISNEDTETGKYETLEIRHQGWANIVTQFELAEDLGYITPLKLKWVGNTISGPQDIQTTQTNETEIGNAFTTAIINLQAANGSLIGVIGYGGSDVNKTSSLIVLDNSPIKSAKDLIGKTVAVNTLAAASETYVRSYLVSEGLTPDEIEKVELIIIPPVSMEQTLRSKQVDSAMMSGIYKDKVLESGGVRLVFSDIDIFGDFTSSLWTMRKSFIEQNPNTTRRLVEGMAKAIEWSKNSPVEEVRERMKDIIRRRNRDEDEKIIDYWQTYGLASKGGLIFDKDIEIWIDWLIKKGDLNEGQIKPSDIYTNEFNPYKDEL
ncbi:ABC transporter substrate-binding protein [Treponema primitia]|uniref:ABC transporter substrate-binding protein n=1 Tax=Treponema primitia TaxID=88058 RepID=UPI003980EB99